MKKQITKTLYLRGKNETMKDAEMRDKKITRVQKKLGGDTTESGVLRHMIDQHPE